MALNIIGFLFLIVGMAVMAITTIAYSRLLNYYRQEVYESLRTRYKASLFILLILLFGFLIGAVDILLRRFDSFYLLAISSALLLGSILIYILIKTQAAAAVMLREKALEAIRAFVSTIDMKEFYSKGHSRAVYDIVNLFYDELVDYHYFLNREKLLDAAILHDIGKINISSSVLGKREQLSNDEWEMIKTHPRRGKEMLDETCFAEISHWVLYHHERVDGNGYYGLVSENIPLEAKIIAIADTYSALCSERIYCPAMDHEHAMDLIAEGAGKKFDRKLVECFQRIDTQALRLVISGA